MKQLQDDVSSKHTVLLDQSKTFAAQAVAPLATVLSQLKLYITQSSITDDKKLATARENLSLITESVAAPSITELSALAAASRGWPARVSPQLTSEQTTAYEVITDAINDASTAAAPREAVCEADVPLSALMRGALPVELGSVELCGVRFHFRARRGCICAAQPLAANITDSNGVEGVDWREPCECGLICETTAKPIWKALNSLYKACGTRARAIDRLVFTNDDDDDDDDDNGHDSQNASSSLSQKQQNSNQDCIDGKRKNHKKTLTPSVSGISEDNKGNSNKQK